MENDIAGHSWWQNFVSMEDVITAEDGNCWWRMQRADRISGRKQVRRG